MKKEEAGVDSRIWKLVINEAQFVSAVVIMFAKEFQCKVYNLPNALGRPK